MLIDPNFLYHESHAAISYSNLSATNWGTSGDTISYCYDANGSMVYKIYADVPGIESMSPSQVDSWLSTNSTVDYDKHIYNLQNCLSRIEKCYDYGVVSSYTEYKYNDSGIRVEKDVDGTITAYLVDQYNHTGYAQVLEQWDTTSAPALTKTYIIGDDVLAQVVNTGTVKYLLYDGHGSTRQLVSGTLNTMTIHDDFSYDGYGVLLQQETAASGNPGKVSQQDTNLLYAGEHFDTHSQNYYLRARWYNHNNGTFNRMDPYSGNTQDPQSLHKYLYVHNNPINNIDPSGNWTMTDTMAVITIFSIAAALFCPVVHSLRDKAKDVAVHHGETEAISFLGEDLDKQMQRDIAQASDPFAQQMNLAFWHDLAEANKSVTYKKALAEHQFLSLIDQGFHAAQVAGIGLGIAKTGALYNTKIIWSKPHGSSAHWKTITENVTRRAVASQTKEIYTNRALSTITGHRTKSLMRPDWAEVMSSGKIRAYEVISPGQTKADFVKKGIEYQKVLGNMLEDYKYIDIGGTIP